MNPSRRDGWWNELIEQPKRQPQGADNESPMVEWSPIRCPACGSRRKTTNGRSRHKPVRYHRCLGCGRHFRSIERG